MDNSRIFLVVALAFISMLLWQEWELDYATPAQGIGESVDASRTAGDTPAIPAQVSIDGSTPTVVAASGAHEPAGKIIDVQTDTLHLMIATEGGTVVDAKLNRYPISVSQQDIKYHLLNRDPADYFIAQSGLLGSNEQRTPNHTAQYSATAERFEMSPSSDQLVVDLTWQSPDGITVIKRYSFQRGSHLVTLEHLVSNNSSEPWVGREYRQFQRGAPTAKGNALMQTYTGGAIYSPADKYQKYAFDALADGKLDRDVDDGWIAMIQHYFLGAFVPPRGEPQHFYGKRLDNGRAVIGAYTAATEVAPGATQTFSGGLYLGPKDQQDLASIATGLDLTVDYGWLVVIAKPIYWILEQIYAFLGNWGWTIIVFTILIKGVFFKLSETSYRSMANMRKLTPRIQALKDRYGDDKQRMQQAMMEMYKKEKVNPLGGCLPMLVQIPFFIALYWVLLESVELRQAPWILWLDDLSVKDPYFVLPVIMAVSMFVQQKLNPAPPDPMQAKIMMALPLVFGVMFAFFPSGLVLYWVVNNLLSISQQWVITRRIEQGAKA